MKNDVLVSVVLPVYNAEKFISSAIQSILNQTYSNFELIVINDGSQDNSLQVIKSFDDSRIIVVSQENKGLIETLNNGIAISKGKYIARMDADDVSLPLRLEKQVEYLEANPDYGVIGTSGMFLEEDLITGDFLKPVSDQNIKDELYFDSPFIHPSIMMRKGLMPKYDSDFYHVEDYALWVKLSKLTKFYNLPQKLIKYRILKSSETRKSQSNYIGRHNALKKVHLYLFELYNIQLNSNEIDQYSYSMYRYNFSLIDPYLLKKVYDKVAAKTNSKVKARLAERWFATFILSKHSFREVLFYLCISYTYLGMMSLCNKKIRDVFS